MPLREVTLPNEIEVSNPPDVKVIQNGKLVDTSAIDNYDEFMTYLMTASIAANTAKIRRLQEDKTSLGRTQNWELNVTPARQALTCIRPAQSLYVVNDGPGTIFVKENTPGRGDATRVLVNEEMTTNFEAHKLERFYVWSAAGTIATARAKIKF